MRSSLLIIFVFSIFIKVNGQCVLTIHQIGTPIADLHFGGYEDSCLVRVNDSILKFICTPIEPEYLAIAVDLIAKPKWIARIWIDPQIKNHGLTIDYNKKTVSIQNPNEWNLITEQSGDLENQEKYQEELAIIIPYIEKNPNSFLSLWFFTHSHGLSIENPQTKLKLFNNLNSSLNKFPLYNQTKIIFSPRNYPKTGDQFKEFVLNDRNDKSFNSNSIKNKWIFLHFWSNSCAPCIREIDALISCYNLIDTSKIAFVSVSLDNDINIWKQSKNTDKLKWVSLWQPNNFYGDLCLQYNLTAIPFVVLFDDNKKLVFTKDGANEIENIKTALQTIK